MHVSGLRGKYSPIKDATPEQIATIAELREEAESIGAFMFEVRYSTWIGAGCAADRKAITVILDGRIWHQVEQNGAKS